MLSQDQSKTLDKIANHPFEFVKSCVFTRDEVDLLSPIKPAPAHLPYVKVFCDIFLRNRLIAVPKSRRMWVTWLVLSCFLWDTLFHRIRANFIQSKKESDADALLDRVEFIFQNIPEHIFPSSMRPKYRRKFCHLEFEGTGSWIKAIPQGADQLRQWTASGVFMDEFGFWEEAETTFGATVPTIQGGGRIVIVSTPPNDAPVGGSFFERLSFDKL